MTYKLHTFISQLHYSQKLLNIAYLIDCYESLVHLHRFANNSAEPRLKTTAIGDAIRSGIVVVVCVV